jgi:predicted MFS family arabinose efflux permease
MSERSADGLLAGLALGLLPAELDLLAVMRWLPADPRRPAGTPVASAVRPLNLLRRRAVAFPVAGGALLAVAVFGAINYLPTFLQLAAGKPQLPARTSAALLAAGLLSAVRLVPLRAVAG